MIQGGGAVDEERERGEEAQEGWREPAPNPTQEKIGEGSELPVDVDWDERDWGKTPSDET